MDMQTLAIAFLVTVAAAGVLWVFVYPTLSGEAKAERRMESVAKPAQVSRTVPQRGQQRSRREQVEETLKELEVRQKQLKRPPLSIQISQAGLGWSKQQFIIISAVLGLVAFAGAFAVDAGLVPAFGIGFAAALGAPRWLLKYLKKRREENFLNAFPDSVDVIVRGIKAGLPLLDCLRIVTNDAPEPVKSEFRQIVESQTIGIPIGEACAKLYERMPLAECNFFGIVISIQQKSGGNLSEALGNLSRVLRDRKKMKAKVQALSMEAKASAAIIGALPFIVATLVYLSSPNYIMPLFTTSTGHLILGIAGIWMSIGIFVMRKMMNFEV
jgi:tight adherence protein B